MIVIQKKRCERFVKISTLDDGVQCTCRITSAALLFFYFLLIDHLTCYLCLEISEVNFDGNRYELAETFL